MTARTTPGRPRLTFYCELETPALVALADRADVLDALKTMRAGVSLGLLDLSTERAQVVRGLHAAGVPVTAWLLLPREQGYFQHVENVDASVARYGALREWTARERLVWAGIGLDIEQDRTELERFGRDPWSAVGVTLRRAVDGRRLDRGLAGYRALTERMRQDGYAVETYQFPSIAEDRRSGSRLLQRAFGMMDLPVDREVWMLYSSILPPRGPAWLASYGAEATSIAVGSTGGGMDGLPPLRWNEFERDLLLARRWTDDVYVFSLEGCVEHGYLDRIARVDWTRAATVEVPSRERRIIDVARLVLRGAGTLSSGVERLAAALRRTSGAIGPPRSSGGVGPW